MKGVQRRLLTGAVVLAYLLLGAVCWHSVEEIHYLKSFFPRRFTVAEALDASIVELVKVAVISLPLLVLIAVGLYLWKNTPPPPRR